MPNDDLALALSGGYGPDAPKPQSEVRTYQFPWYQRINHELIDRAYGPHATAQDLRAVQRIPLPVKGLAAAGYALRDALERRMLVGQGQPLLEAIQQVGDPRGRFEPGARESRNALVDTSGQLPLDTARAILQRAYGEQPEPEDDFLHLMPETR
jgi:hypothetical protein